MARRRYQNPKPKEHRGWWTIRLRIDKEIDGKLVRDLRRIRLIQVTDDAGKAVSKQEVKRLRDEYCTKFNQGTVSTIASATTFKTYVELKYIPDYLSLRASSTRGRNAGIIKNYLLPEFGAIALRDLDRQRVQQYFSGMKDDKELKELAHGSKDKILKVLSAILSSAVGYDYIKFNPATKIVLPRPEMGVVVRKPTITYEQFCKLIAIIPEPYATMVYVALYSGLRVSELVGLKWDDVGERTLRVNERYCRGDWSAPKSKASNAEVAVAKHVIDRIHALKSTTVLVRAGRATRKFKAVKADGPNDLVFQSVQDGKPMRDNNILCRWIKPAAKQLKLDFVNWRCLRTSSGTWFKQYGADLKDIQGHLRHAHLSTTGDFYVQDIPESRHLAAESLPFPTMVRWSQ